MSLKTIFIIIISLILVTLIGGAGYLWYQAKSTRGFEIKVEVPEEVVVGVPFEVVVTAENDSVSILEDAELSLEIPEELVFVGKDSGDIIEFKDLGNLGVGSIAEERFSLVALYGENNIRQIIVSVSYTPGSVGSRFKKTAEAPFSILGTSIGFDIEIPNKVFGGEAFTLRMKYENKGTTDMNDLSLTLAAPQAFTIKSASLDITSKNTWQIGTLKAGSQGEIVITGVLVGPDNAFFEFDAILEAIFGGRKYPISEKSAAISIAPSPLSLTIDLNNIPEYVTVPGDDLNYRLTFQNSTDVGLRDVVITAQLIGAMFDLTSISSSAFLRSHDNTLVWNAANTPELGLLNPGASGFVDFSLKTKSAYPIVRLSDRNFTLRVKAAIESPTVPFSVEGNKTMSMAELETKVQGRTEVDARVLYRDAASGIVNTGSLPLKVGKPTQFTVHWVLTNYSNDVENVEVKAFLGGNVRFTGIAKSTGETQPIYNDRTQEMVWSIPTIPSARGVLNKPLEAIFQIEAMPSINQVGSVMLLIQQTTLNATDAFTKLPIIHTDSAITSGTLDDPTVNSSQGLVQP